MLWAVISILAVVLLCVDLFYVSINVRIAPVKEIAECE
jgi:hypothetical protein